MNPEILTAAAAWQDPIFDDETRAEVTQLIEQSGDALTDAFYKDLEFGTGGMRGVMGAGTNRVNKYTLGLATQGLSNYLHKAFKGEEIKVAIAYDCRHNSDTFARVVAEILSANGVRVYLFESLRPTPQLSFTVRDMNCHAGIVLTASHNPPEYNGYKVYWSDGAQIVAPHDKGIIEEVRKVTVPQILFHGDDDLIEVIGAEADKRFQAASVEQSRPVEGREDLKIVFTSIHGTSIKAIPQVLEKAGYKQVFVVEEQATPDGNFPTVKSPNPEEPEALAMAFDLAQKVDADILIGTDPDADRIGVGVRNRKGEMVLLNGNQTAAVITAYLCERWKNEGLLTGKQYLAQTIVTSQIIEEIGKGYDLPTYYCLTGFKWIADIIAKKEGSEQFICGGEESYGYMVGDFVRDKDSVTSALICCEAAAWAKSRGSSFYELMCDTYAKYGMFQERLISLTKKGMNGAQEIAQMMSDFREHTPEAIGGVKVAKTHDYESSTTKDLLSGQDTRIDLPKSNVFQIELEDGSIITARPSGTEPKIKFYISLKGQIESANDFEKEQDKLNRRIDEMLDELQIG